MSDDSSSDDDVPLGELVQSDVKKAAAARASKAKAEESEDSDSSSDDVPLAQMNKRKPTTTKSSAPKAKKPKPAPAAKPKSAAKNPTDLFYLDTVKGQAIQKLICRWWYAIEWPSQEDLEKPVPPGFEALDGYPGVFIGVKGDQMGAIHDNRDPGTCPNFHNLKKKSTEEIKTLLIKALETQREKLIEHEGASSPYLSQITKDLNWAQRLNPTKVDKEAAKFRWGSIIM